ncbi:MAG TPA: acyltransferase family protein [Ilumatobacteraceae bacterium]|nr:acyltransferase family protein [Ilumatobacteraceae bacterium]
MTTVVDSPGAARSLVDEGVDDAVHVRTPDPSVPSFPSMGYQPSLDGLRALSVGVVLLYHAGFSWMHGGFFGVEVFFVVSGFLITSLLIDEHDRNDRIAFGKFWNRRARRLFPALYAVLLFVGVWAALAGTAEQQSQLRRDTVWSIFYVNNWGQILGDVPYFAGEAPLLRHLWSLAVEEQWYLIWPLLFVALMRLRLSRRVVGGIVVGAAFAVFVYMFWMQTRAPTPLGGPPAILDGADRTNYLYLSTITRSGGLLLGAGAAFVWRPWRWKHAVDAPAGRLLDPLGAAAVAAIGCAAAVASITAGYVYQWLLPLVSILSLVAVMVAVHPSSVGFRRMMSWTPLVEVGKRSYGLYLWSWPIFVIVGATTGSVSAFLWAMFLTVIVAEASYRYLETPVRKGIVGRWWSDRASITYWPIAGGALLVGALVLFYVNVDAFNRFEGGDEAVFELDGAVAPDSPAGAAVDVVEPVDVTDGSVAAVTTVATTPIVPATSARLAIVGDSQANALAINLPDGIETAFPNVVNGSVDGCSVYDSGSVRSSVRFGNNFSICQGWQDEWAQAAAGTDVALVVVGAWDVFDVVDGDTTYGFATPAGDALFVTNLESGIDAMLAEGANVGLLEVACMRPQDVEGAGVPALPERGDDARVAHVNDLLRETAASYQAAGEARVQFVEGPTEWCTDETIATDLGYRWDGVHVYKPGANLVYTTVAPDLLRLAAV